jgi:hypothetical protein
MVWMGGKLVDWRYCLRASPEERMASRVLQVLGIQQLQPSEFHLHVTSGTLHIDFVVCTDKAKAQRVGLLLRRLERVNLVFWLPLATGDQPLCIDQVALSLRSQEEHPPDTDPDSGFWSTAPSIRLRMDSFGRPVCGNDTEVRLRWTPDNFYFLFLCNYEELWPRPLEPVLDRPTAELWKWDVAEVFIGTGQHPLTQYCEFELSPRGEWLDLRIDCMSGGGIVATPLDSKIAVAASQSQQKQMWNGFLRVPCAAVFSGQAEAGQRLRINFFRSQGANPTEITWRPGYSKSFHVPTAFGELLLIE